MEVAKSAMYAWRLKVQHRLLNFAHGGWAGVNKDLGNAAIALQVHPQTPFLTACPSVGAAAGQKLGCCARNEAKTYSAYIFLRDIKELNECINE